MTHHEPITMFDTSAVVSERAGEPSTSPLHYDGAPRPITEEEAKTIAHEEYVIGRGANDWAMYRGADGGYHVFEPSRRGQDAITFLNVKRKDLRERIMRGDCTHTIFYNRATDAFYCG